MANAKLFDLVGHYLPKIPAKERTKFLYNATSHPCGDRERVRQQIIRLSKETDGTIAGCLAFSKREFDQDVAEVDDFDPGAPEVEVDPYAADS